MAGSLGGRSTGQPTGPPVDHYQGRRLPHRGSIGDVSRSDRAEFDVCRVGRELHPVLPAMIAKYWTERKHAAIVGPDVVRYAGSWLVTRNMREQDVSYRSTPRTPLRCWNTVRQGADDLAADTPQIAGMVDNLRH